LWSEAAEIKGSRDGLGFNGAQTVVIAAVALGMVAAVDRAAIPTEVWLLVLLTGIPHALYLYWLNRGLADADIHAAFRSSRRVLVQPGAEHGPQSRLPIQAVFPVLSR